MPWRTSNGSMWLRGATLGAALWLWVGLSAGASGNGESGTGDADCVERAVALVQQRYEGIRNLRARFRQSSHSMALGAGRAAATTTSRGRVAFAKPGRMRWSYEEPEPSLVVSDGRTLSLYDPSRGELQRLPISEGFLSGTAIQFLLGEGDLRREFEVAPIACEADAFELDLVPRKPATYERLRLRIDAASGDVVRTGIVDLLGNRTEVEFADIEVDFDPPPELFQLEPPEGTRIIDLGVPGAGPEG